MRFVSWNVNGLRSALQQLRDLTSAPGKRPGVLLLQELKCSQGRAEELLGTLGYAHVTCLSAKRPGYSGVAVASDAHPLARLPLPADAPAEATDEGRVIALEYERVVLVCVYTPHSKRDLSRLAWRTETWDPWFRGFLEGLAHAHPRKPLVVGGDFNCVRDAIDIHNPAVVKPPRPGYTEPEREQLATTVATLRLNDTFRALHPRAVRYSWWSPFLRSRERNKGWRIDYLFAQDGVRCMHADVWTDVQGSDHAPVVLDVAG